MERRLELKSREQGLYSCVCNVFMYVRVHMCVCTWECMYI